MSSLIFNLLLNFLLEKYNINCHKFLIELLNTKLTSTISYLFNNYNKLS